MEQKRAVSAKLAAKYRGSKSKRQRSMILGQVVGVNGYNRHYAAWVLRNFGKVRLVRGPGGALVRVVVGHYNRRPPAARPATYDEAVRKVLVFIWECFDQMCGKRLRAILPEILGAMIKGKRLAKGGAEYEKLRAISPATIDRLLKEERAKRRLKGIAHTKPTSVLKSQIPIVISSELPVGYPGHFQIDLVGHDGGNPNGQFAFTLNAVELYSGWVEVRPLLNKAHRWSKEAIQSVQKQAPLPIRSLHSDNDSSFLNEPLQSWCRSQGIAYSRSRPYHSNDTCYVEQKNYNIVRQAVGYARYETEEEVAVMAKLYEGLRLLINFFYPSMKLLEKKRVHGRISKRYDAPRTPARRLLESAELDKVLKSQLRYQMRQLDPFVLKRDIARAQTQLLELVRKKNMRILYPGPAYPEAAELKSRALFG